MNRKFLLLAAVAVSSACHVDTTGPASQVSGTYPGFDTSIYPGDAAMVTWKSASPYVWSGYYLMAPCHRGATWLGKRVTLEKMGWGLAVIYVGQQAFEGVPDILAARRDVVDAPDEPSGATDATVTCSRTLLSHDEGVIDANDAIAKTRAEGFAPGTVIYLDVEHMDVIPAEMNDYYKAWAEQVRIDGRFSPGVYVAKSNAAAVHADLIALFQADGVSVSPRFWVASSNSGFSLDKRPSDVGLPFANLWQGILDTDETWGGVSTHIDVDVADRPYPSSSN